MALKKPAAGSDSGFVAPPCHALLDTVLMEGVAEGQGRAAHDPGWILIGWLEPLTVWLQGQAGKQSYI